MGVSLHHWFGKLGVIGTVAIFGASLACAQTGSVREELAAFFNTYVGRPLSSSELDRVTAEFQASFGDAESCTRDCRNVLANMSAHRATLARSPGSPQELLIRHAYVSMTWFDPRDDRTLLREMLTQSDPVVVFDPRTLRLMTRRDLDAIASLDLLAKTGKLPQPQKPSSEDIAKAIDMLNRAFGPQGTAPLPVNVALAAELWAGLRQHWPALSAEERHRVRDHIRGGLHGALPAALYRRLLGVSSPEAQQLVSAASSTGSERGSASALHRYLELMGAATSTAIIVGASGVP